MQEQKPKEISKFAHASLFPQHAFSPAHLAFLNKLSLQLNIVRKIIFTGFSDARHVHLND